MKSAGLAKMATEEQKKSFERHLVTEADGSQLIYIRSPQVTLGSSDDRIFTFRVELNFRLQAASSISELLL